MKSPGYPRDWSQQAMVGTIAGTLGSFGHRLKAVDVPAECRARARILILDAIALACAAYDTRPCQLAMGLAKDLRSTSPTSTIWFSDFRAMAMDAVLANTVFVGGLLGDDQLQGAFSHPESILIPTAISVGEQEHSSGVEVGLAIVLGYDVIGRLGAKFKFATPAHERGFRLTPLLGTIGAAATAARLLHLDEAAFANTLACSASFACGLIEPTLSGGMEWRFQNAVAARNGILAASLARRGLTAAPTGIEGSYGFIHAYSGLDEVPAEVTADLGKEFYINHVNVKPMPSEGANQAVGLITQRLMHDHRIDPRQIVSIKLTVLPHYLDHKSSQFPGPFTTVEQALFSMRFGIAAVAVDGGISAATYRDVTRSDLAAMAAKIEVESGGEPKDFPRFLNASVEIRVADGTVFKGGRELIDLNEFYPNIETARAKFLRLTASALSPARARSICDLVLDQFEGISDIGKLTKLLAPKKEVGLGMV